MKAKIIYILGCGRSGTTLLDIILGNAPNIFSTGELNRFLKRNGIPHTPRDNDVKCFWEKISDEIRYKEGKTNLYDLYPLVKKYEYHSSFYRMFIPFKNKESFHAYSAFQRNLFTVTTEHIRSLFNKEVIVDSSKYPLRAFFLSKIFATEISFIYVRRNPVSVVNSFQKKEIEQPPKSRTMANLYLLCVNILAKRIVERLKKFHKMAIVNYEELLASPVEAISKLETDLQIDLSAVKQRIKNSSPLKVGFLFDGNRLRHEQEIIFKKSSTFEKPKTVIDTLFYPLHKLTWYK